MPAPREVQSASRGRSKRKRMMHGTHTLVCVEGESWRSSCDLKNGKWGVYWSKQFNMKMNFFTELKGESNREWKITTFLDMLLLGCTYFRYNLKELRWFTLPVQLKWRRCAYKDFPHNFWSALYFSLNWITIWAVRWWARSAQKIATSNCHASPCINPI